MSQLPLLLDAAREQSIDNFQVGDNAAVFSVLQYPLKHDFIYLQGARYAGKTHLLKALQQQYESVGESVQWIGTDMVSEQSLLDVLPQAALYIVDDVDQIASDADAENGLFQLYNHVHPTSSALVLASNLSPQDAQWQLPDLVSRLNSGQTLHLKALRGEPAFALFSELCQHMGLEVSERALNYLRVHSHSSFPELYRLLILLNQRTLSERKRISIVLLKQLLEELQQV